MHRSAPRLSRILLCAAVPVMLVAAGCSSDSDDGQDKGKDKASGASASAGKTSASPTVEPAKFAALPDPCKAVTAKTIKKIVPSAKKASGTAGKSNDDSVRGSCSWNGLDDKGVKGSQYRWLDIGFVRYDSDQALGSGADRATTDYTKSVTKAQAAEGAKKLATTPVSGLGDQATAITYDLNKTDEDFKYAAIVVRTANVVVSVNYNGTGYAGAKAPSASDILQGAQAAAKEAVAALDGTGGASADDGGGSSSPSASPKASSSASPKTSSSKSAGSDDSPKTSSSESTGSDDDASPKATATKKS